MSWSERVTLTLAACTFATSLATLMRACQSYKVSKANREKLDEILLNQNDGK